MHFRSEVSSFASRPVEVMETESVKCEVYC